MKVTIEIPEYIVNKIKDAFSEKFVAEMGMDELVAFLKEDVTSIYVGEFENDEAGLYDALDMFIAD